MIQSLTEKRDGMKIPAEEVVKQYNDNIKSCKTDEILKFFKSIIVSYKAIVKTISEINEELKDIKKDTENKDLKDLFSLYTESLNTIKEDGYFFIDKYKQFLKDFQKICCKIFMKEDDFISKILEFSKDYLSLLSDLDNDSEKNELLDQYEAVLEHIHEKNAELLKNHQDFLEMYSHEIGNDGEFFENNKEDL